MLRTGFEPPRPTSQVDMLPLIQGAYLHGKTGKPTYKAFLHDWQPILPKTAFSKAKTGFSSHNLDNLDIRGSI